MKGPDQASEPSRGDRTFRLISFHTDDTLYTAAAARLKASADRLSIPVHIETVRSRGSWGKNAAFKSEFVRDQWRKSDIPIVWLDADATLNAVPTLFTALDADFAIHKRDNGRFFSATIYFGRSPAAAALLDRWVDRCRAVPRGDQANLQHAWGEITREFPLQTAWLPQSYCCKFDEDGVDKAIIVQWQATRQSMWLRAQEVSAKVTPARHAPSHSISIGRVVSLDGAADGTFLAAHDGGSEGMKKTWIKIMDRHVDWQRALALTAATRLLHAFFPKKDPLDLSGAPPRLILHVGTHRTGTTSIQTVLASNRKRLRRQGLYPDGGAVFGQVKSGHH